VLQQIFTGLAGRDARWDYIDLGASSAVVHDDSRPETPPVAVVKPTPENTEPGRLLATI
jgi:hypothetical protein